MAGHSSAAFARTPGGRGRPRTRGTAAAIAAGRRLRAAREVSGLTQRQLARASQRGQATIAKQELGRCRVPARWWTWYAKVYGVTQTWLLGEDDVPCADATRAAQILEKVASIAAGIRARVRRSDGPAEVRVRWRAVERPMYLDAADALKLRTDLSVLIASNDAVQLRAERLRIESVLEMHAPAPNLQGVECGEDRNGGAGRELLLDVVGATPLGEALLRRAWRAAQVLLEFGADALAAQHFAWPPNAKATPWLMALELGAPVRDVLVPMLRSAVGLLPDDEVSSTDILRRDIELDVQRVKYALLTEAGGRDGQRLYEIACRWTARRAFPTVRRRARNVIVGHLSPPSAVAASDHGDQLSLDVGTKTLESPESPESPESSESSSPG
jgi:transcriptional regulator with XRE-family HTH domain